MYLEEYKKLKTFEEQEDYLLENMANELNRVRLILEINSNFEDFVQTSKTIDEYDAFRFYIIFLMDDTTLPIILNNFEFILKQEYVDIDIIETILSYYSKDKILKNPSIQEDLRNVLNKSYNKTSFDIIENYFPEKEKEQLFFSQINHFVNAYAPNTKSYILKFIKCLFNDPMFNAKFTYINSGLFKDCFSLGKYILKLEEKCHKHELPKSRHFLSPILYKEFEKLVISIYPIVNIPIEETEKDKFWKQLLNEGIINFDSTNYNYGKMKEDWQNPYKNNSKLSKSILGIDKFNLDDKQKGEIVCTDFDFAIYASDNSTDSQSLKEYFDYENKKAEYYYRKNLSKKI